MNYLPLRKYPELDALRFFAASSVVLHHFYFSDVGFFSWFKYYGHFGVDVFFVLSGFIITLGALAQKKPFNYKQFLVRRAFRLWPTLYAALTISSVMMVCFAMKDPVLAANLKTKLWHYYFHFANYSYAYSGKLHHMVGIYWSLAVEEHFYLLWGGLLAISNRRLKFLNVALVFMIILPYLFRVFHYANGDSTIIIDFTTHTRLDSLAIGCLLAIGYPYLKWKGAMVDLMALPALLLFFYLGFVIAYEPTLPVYVKALDVLSISIGSVLLIILALNPGGVVHRVLRVPALAYLGILSYGVYLFHPITHAVIFYFAERFAPGTPHWVIAIIGFAVPYIPAYLFYITVDRYFLALRDRVLKTAL